MPTLAGKYALVMGSLAMSVAMLRAVKDSEHPEAAVWTAMGLMLVFAAIGLAVGWLADALIVDSVRAQAEAELQDITSRTAQKADSPQVP